MTASTSWSIASPPESRPCAQRPTRAGSSSPAVAFQATAVRCRRGLRCRSAHRPTLPPCRAYSAWHGGLHDRGRCLAARGFVARPGCGPTAPRADRWYRAGQGVAPDVSNGCVDQHGSAPQVVSVYGIGHNRSFVVANGRRFLHGLPVFSRAPAPASSGETNFSNGVVGGTGSRIANAHGYQGLRS